MAWAKTSAVLSVGLASASVEGAAHAQVQASSEHVAQRERSADPMRVASLQTHVDRSVRTLTLTEIFGGVEVALAAAGIGLGAYSWRDDRPTAVALVAGGSLEVAAFGAAALSSRSTMDDMLKLAAPMTIMVYGVAGGVSDFADPKERTSFWAVVAGQAGAAALDGSNILLRRGSNKRLRELERELVQDGTLAATDFARLERDYLDVANTISPALTALPLGLSGAVAIAPALMNGSTDREKRAGWILGGAQLFTALIRLGATDWVDRYRDDVSVSVAAGPLGVGVSGRF